MKHFHLQVTQVAHLYVQEESEEAALAKWGETFRVTLEDEHGIAIEPTHPGFEDLDCDQQGKVYIEEVDERGVSL